MSRPVIRRQPTRPDPQWWAVRAVAVTLIVAAPIVAGVILPVLLDRLV